MSEAAYADMFQDVRVFCSTLNWEGFKKVYLQDPPSVLEILIHNYSDICFLEYLTSTTHDPPLLTPEHVKEYDLFAFFVEESELLDGSGTSRRGDFQPEIFRFLLELDPSAVATTFGHGNYLPIHIFCSRHAAENIEDEDEFFADLERLLSLGVEYHVGVKNGVSGFGGLFERRKGSPTLEAPCSALFHHFKYPHRNRNSRAHHFLDSPRFLACIESLNVSTSLLEAAVLSEVGLCFVDDIVERMNQGDTIAGMRNCDGRLPLHYTIASKVLEGFALHRVIDADVGAMEEIDPVTGLLPFLLAASVDYCDSQMGLDMTYMLLRRHPILIYSAEISGARHGSAFHEEESSCSDRKRKREGEDVFNKVSEQTLILSKVTGI